MHIKGGGAICFPAAAICIKLKIRLPKLCRVASVRGMNSNLFVSAFTAISLGLAAAPSHATGLATCQSGGQDHWQPQEKLTAKLKEQGWDVRRIKVDGGCYEVYALDGGGKRVEAYFHPRTLAPVPVGSKDHEG